MASPVEEIKSRLAVAEVVGSYVRLSKAGANFKAACPFHNEKTPSFFVSPSRESWHCFGCGAGGDIFQFVKQIEGVEFPEALEILARRAGVTLKKEDPRLTSERKRLFDLMEAATRYFESELKKNKEVLEYLKKRGVTDESIKSFRLGYALLGWEGLFGHLLARGFKGEEMEKAGLVLKSSNPNARTKFYDRFRARIMFPIADASGRIVAFSGRIFEPAVLSTDLEKMGGKYINSPQTLLYDKSNILYLWDRAKNEVRRENACILVEGQMDALMSHQAGVKNAVAVSGTALSKGHLFLIKRLTPKLLLAFDTDEAGEAATRRSVDLALEAGLDVSVIDVPQAKDPAEIIKENPQVWQEAVKASEPVISFFLKRLSLKWGDDLRTLRREANSRVLPYIAKIENEIEKAHWVQEASKTLALAEAPLWEELKKLASAAARQERGLPKEVEPLAIIKTRRDLLEERILGLLAWKKGEFLESIPSKYDFFSEHRQPLFECVLKEKIPEGGKLLKENLEKLALEAELLYGEMPARDTSDSDAGGERVHEEFHTLLKELELEHAKSRLTSLASEIRQSETAGNKTKLKELLGEFKNFSEKLKER